MLDFVLGKIVAIPGYFWSLVFAWAAIEVAGWLRVRNSRKKRRFSRFFSARSTEQAAGGDPVIGVGIGGRFARWGLRRRVY